MYDLDVQVKQDIKQPLEKIDIEVSKKFKDFIDDKENINQKEKIEYMYKKIKNTDTISMSVFKFFYELF